LKRVLGTSFFILILALFFGSTTSAAGTSIANGAPVTKQLSKGYAHTYQFTTNKDGEVYITLDNATGGFYVKLSDSYGNTKDYNYFSSGGSSIDISTNLAQGTYYIEVSPYSWSGISSASYRLKATYASSFTRNYTTFEPNDTTDTSLKMSNGKFYSSKAESRVDRDVYKFTTSTDGEIYITLDQAKAGFYAKLVDSNGKTVDYDYFSSAGNTVVLKADASQGTYYLYIEPYSWSGTTSATYRVKATYPSAVTRDTTTFEPNETAETSMSMISNKLYYSSSYSKIDRDVYKFTTNADGKATIVLDNNTAGYSVYLYDIYGNSVDYDYTYSAGNTLVISEDLQKGTYYLYINPYSWSGTTSATYRLKASFIDKTPSIDPIYDINYTLTGKAVSNTKVYVYAGSTKLGETTAKNSKYSIKIPKQKAGTTIGVYTIDSAGNRSTTKTTVVVNSSIKTASAAYNKIKVSWYSVPGANGYEIYRSTSGTGTYSRVGTVTSGSTLSYVNSNVTTGATYYYKVRAYRVIGGTKVYSPYTKYTSGKAIPSAPYKVTAKKASATAMTLTWTRVDGASGYQVYRATSKTGTYSAIVTTSNGSTLNYINRSLSPGKTYYYKVRAYRTVNGKKVFGNFSTILSYKHY
jgi:uncharacterized protein YfaP (DUF2135 family)